MRWTTLLQPACRFGRIPVADAQPTSHIVKVDLDAAVKKLAVEDGVTDSAELMKVVGVKRYDQYAAQVRSYYAGYDVGYRDGVALMGRPLRKMLLIMSAVSAIVGAVLALGTFHFFSLLK